MQRQEREAAGPIVSSQEGEQGGSWGPHFLLLCVFWYPGVWGDATHILGMVPHLSQVSGSSLTDALRAFP